MNNKVIAALIVLATATAVSAGALPYAPWMPTRGRETTHPAIETLRGCAATVHTNLGDIEIAFEPDDAPNAVRNFIKLALKGFYDGSRIYGVFADTMVLAGDPTATGKGDVGYTLDFERSFMGHDAGTLAMDTAPADPKDKFAPRKSSGSRFFINVARQRHLDRDYTVFATITKGIAVAERIGRARTRPTDGAPAPVEDIVIERITVRTKEKKTSAEPKEQETK